jgi:S-formylglutathione hydrolase
MKTSKPILILFFLVLFCPSITFSAGTVVYDSLFSTSLNKYMKVNVYLPQGYNPSGSTRYRVIYFLHGAGENQNSHIYLYSVLDSLIGNNLIQPVICVKPDGSAPPYLGSFYTNSALYGAYEDYIYMDVIQYIDSHYKTIAARNSRCIMGHSMGGYGCIKMAFKHPNLFRAVASNSGPLDFTHIYLAVPYVLAECGGGPPYTYSPSNGLFTAYAFTYAGAFSPNLNSPPYFVNFILDSTGAIIDSIYNKWKLHSPERLSMNITSATNLAIYFDCGLQDELTLLEWNNGFRDTLIARNIPFVYHTFNGTHNSQNRSRSAIIIRFLDSAMNTTTVIEPVRNQIPDKISLYQNYPNPFNPVTKINYELPSASSVKLAVYDVLGREVAVLVGGKQSAGKHEIKWDASNYTSGTYFYKLTTGDYTRTKKMMLVK